MEYDLFCEVRNRIAAEVVRIQKTAKAVAKLDTFVSLAVVADQNNYCRPKINENGVIDIKDGRHPVVEKMMNNDMFIANDTYLDNGNNRISIITGPNMAGKSTYMTSDGDHSADGTDRKLCSGIFCKNSELLTVFLQGLERPMILQADRVPLW